MNPDDIKDLVAKLSQARQALMDEPDDSENQPLIAELLLAVGELADENRLEIERLQAEEFEAQHPIQAHILQPDTDTDLDDDDLP